MTIAKTKIKQNVNDVALTTADVARDVSRDLKIIIDPKRARAFLRNNVELYVARKQRFTKSSTLYKKTYDALCEYAKTRIVVTK